MEVLLTLESVVDNLAECLKNNDLMAILTRFVSPLHMLMIKEGTFSSELIEVIYYLFWFQSLLSRFPHQPQAAVQQEEHRAAQSQKRGEEPTSEELFCPQEVRRGGQMFWSTPQRHTGPYPSLWTAGFVSQDPQLVLV